MFLFGWAIINAVIKKLTRGYHILFSVGLVYTGCIKSDSINQTKKPNTQVQQSTLSSGTRTESTRPPFYTLDLTWPKSLPVNDTTLDSIEQLLRACMTGNFSLVEHLIESGISADSSGLTGRTPLMVAARYGHADIVAYLCSLGVEINQMRKFLGGWSSSLYPFCDISGGSAILECAINGDTSIMKILISHGADIHQRNVLKNTAIFYSVQEGHEGMTRFLLKNGADVNCFNSMYQTPLSYAVRANRKEIVELLCKHGGKIAPQTLAGAISAAVDSNDLAMATLLLSTGIIHDTIIQRSPDYRCTPLGYAASHGRTGVVRLLLKHGASVEGISGCNYTPFFEAAVNGHDSIAEILLGHGAKIPEPQTYSRDMWIEAVHSGNTELIKLLLKHAKPQTITAFFQQRKENILMLKGPMFDLLFPLCSSQLHIDVKSDSFTNAFYSKYRPPRPNNCPKVPVGRIAALMRYGATFNAESFGITPLMLYAAAGFIDSIKAYIGEDNPRNMMREININMRINGCNSALDYAIVEEQISAVKLLVQSGASLDIIPNEYHHNWTRLPLDHAFSTRNKEIVTYLLSKGARSQYYRLVNGFPPDLVYNHLMSEYGRSNFQYLPPILTLLQLGWKDLFFKELDRADTVLSPYDYRAAFFFATGWSEIEIAEELLRRHPELSTELFFPPENTPQDGREPIDSAFVTYGGTAFFHASQFGRLDILKFLVQKTTPPNGWRPFIAQSLIYAENYGRRQTAEFLVKLYYGGTL